MSPHLAERRAKLYFETTSRRVIVGMGDAVSRQQEEFGMKIGVLGSGIVAQTLATGFLRHGHDTMVGTRDKTKLAGWHRENPKALIGSFGESATFGKVVVLAVKGLAAADALRAAGSDNLSRKPVIDATNPIADAPPTHGVLKFFTSYDESLMERLQREFPGAHFVKAFSSVGNRQFVNPQYKAGKPTMFICGNDEAAKKTVTQILDQFGWETADMGQVEAARAIEPLCMLWCIPGFLRNEWAHAFKLLRE
jgi:predicted dinucleotide-binding enzyme